MKHRVCWAHARPTLRLWLPWLLALLALACHGESAERVTALPAATAPAAPLVVRLGYQKIGPPFLLKERAQALDGRLGERSARAEWVEFPAGPPLLEAMRGGAVDIGYVGETPPVFAQAGGVPFVYVAAEPPAPEAEAIVVPNGSPIADLTQLKGKKVALNRGSNVHYLLLRALRSAGLQVSDVEVVYLAPADARSAFESGQVDAWVIWDPFLAAAELAGARSLRNGAGLVDNHFFYVVRREFAERQPALVQLVLEEYRTLSDWARQHPEDAARSAARSSGVSYEALLRAERRHTYGLRSIDRELLARQQTIADSFRELKLIPTEIRTGQAFLERVAYAAP